MKKFVSLVLCVMMLAGSALACDCTVPAEVRMSCFAMAAAGVDDADINNALAMIAVGESVECSVAKTGLLNALLIESIRAKLTETQINAIVEYITRCECGHCGVTESEPVPAATPTPAPTKKPQVKPQATVTPKTHTHSGGNHENNGVCTECGVRYQTHEEGGWIGRFNSTWHYSFCVYPNCGVRYNSQNHSKTRKVSEDANGITWFCGACEETFWVKKTSTQTSFCCERCGHASDCCNGCECGCGMK